MKPLQYNINFEVAALFTFAVTMFYSYTGKNLPNIINRLYKIMLCVGFCASFFDILAVITITYGKIVPYWLNYGFNYIHVVFQNSMTCLWFLYIYHFTRKMRFKKWWEIILAIPVLLVIVFLFISMFPDRAFRLDPNGMFYRGPAMLFIYLSSFCYLMLSLFYVFLYKKGFTRNQRAAITVFVLLSGGAILIQAVIPTLLIVGFASSIGCIVLYISLQNPEERIDRNTGIFNRTTATAALSDYLEERKNFSMIVLAIDEFQKVNTDYGYEIGDELLKKIGRFLSGLTAGLVCRLDGDNIALIFEQDVLTAQEAVDVIQARFLDEWNAGESFIRLTTCICCLFCPRDAKTVSEIFDIVNNTIREAKAMGKGTICYASEHIENREKRILELEEQKSLLEQITMEAEAARMEAERADRTKSIFLANMSHEIRTPMNAILGMAELVLREETLPSQPVEYVMSIKKAGESLLDLINDILDISKIESGRLEIINDRYYLSSVIHDIINMICSRLQKKDVEFLVEVDHRLPDELIGDELRIRQILLNILGNAVKFTTKGYVSLKIYGTVENNSVSLFAEVEDTGFGIRKEDIDKLFDGFQRLDDKKTRQIEGTGLGLAICQQLLGLMGGTIEAESTYGAGSRFTVYLPQKINNTNPIIEVKNINLIKVLVIVEDETAHPQMASIMKNLGVSANYELDSDRVWGMIQDAGYTHVFVPYFIYVNRKESICRLVDVCRVIVITEYGRYVEYGPNLSAVQKPLNAVNVGEALNGIYDRSTPGQVWESFTAPEAKILIVDDNAVNLKVMEGLLLPYKVQITKALSGKECLKLLQSKQYHLVFLDHMMPEMDGVETLNIIRSQNEDYYKQLKVVALTANAIRGAREMFLENGFDDYISKPIDLARLDEKLKTYLPKEFIEKGELREIEPVEEFPFEIAGVSTKQGIKNCSGSVKMYWDLLSTVLMEGRVKLPLMGEYIATDNIKSYQVEVHALKSVASGIGAQSLSSLAKKHEEEAKAGNYYFIRSKGGELLKQYEELLRQLEGILKAWDKKSGEKEEIPIAPRELKKHLEIICGSIMSYEDEEAVRGLDYVLRFSLDGQVSLKLLKSLEALKVLDYKEALAILREQIALIH